MHNSFFINYNLRKERGKMILVGVVSDNKSFKTVKNNIRSQEINLIQINNNSIDNIKNIKFEIIVINKEIEKLKDKIKIIELICSKSKYLIINTDINSELFYFEGKNKPNIITFGLNHKATVTLSSITECSLLICLQKNIKDKNNKLIEIGEKQIKISKENKIKTYEIFIIFIISIIIDETIILKT